MVTITTYLERIVNDHSSFLLFGDRFYNFTDDLNGENYLQIGENRISLSPSIPYHQWESFDDETQTAAIERFKQEYIAGQINSQLQGKGEIESKQRKATALQFIVFELLPLFVSRKYAATEALDLLKHPGTKEEADSPVDQARREIEKLMVNKFGESTKKDKKDNTESERIRTSLLEKERKIVRDPLIRLWYSLPELGLTANPTPSFLGEVIQHQPFYVQNGFAHRLKPWSYHKRTDEKEDKSLFLFHILGKDYNLEGGSYEISRIAQELTQKRESRWKIEALEQAAKSFDELNATLQERSQRNFFGEKLSELKEFDIEGSGFIKLEDRDEYYVYVTIPKFATQDGRDQKVFWPYDATKVAIIVGSQNNGVYSRERPFVIERRETHPCLDNRTRDGQFFGICNLNREPSSYQNNALDMARKLSDGINVITHPLSKESLDSHRGHSYFGETLTKILTQKSLTRAQAVKKGYAVYEVVESSRK